MGAIPIAPYSNINDFLCLFLLKLDCCCQIRLYSTCSFPSSLGPQSRSSVQVLSLGPQSRSSVQVLSLGPQFPTWMLLAQELIRLSTQIAHLSGIPLAQSRRSYQLQEYRAWDGNSYLYSACRSSLTNTVGTWGTVLHPRRDLKILTATLGLDRSCIIRFAPMPNH